MKKIILLLTLLFSFAGFAQFFEGFEGSSTALPVGWDQYNNGVGAGPNYVWKATASTPSLPVCVGNNAAFLQRNNIGVGNTEEDYLVTPQITVPVNGEVRFVTKQSTPGNQNTRYRLLISTNTDKTILTSYNLIKEWNENELNAVNSVCQQHKVDLTAYGGQQVFIAFERVFTMTTSTGFGDDMLFDDFSVVPQCVTPSDGEAINVYATKATLKWVDVTALTRDVEIVKKGILPTGVPTHPNVSNPFDVSGLEQNTEYEFYVKVTCQYSPSEWAGPYPFKTESIGAFCTEPFTVNTLPYQSVLNTGNFTDSVRGLNGSSCGAIPPTVDYLAGNDAFYKFTPTQSGMISVKMTPNEPNSGVFVYENCPVTPAPNFSGTVCVAGFADNSSNVRFFKLNVEAGKTYTIVVSSSTLNPTIGYNLVIQKEVCDMPTALTATAIGTQTATLSWTNNSGSADFQVAVQELGASIPSGSEAYIDNVVNSTTFNKTGLQAGVRYQYYVRAKCTSGTDYSAWAGPYFFNTEICEESQKCLYTFSMTSANQIGWQGATMQIRQEGIVLLTIGGNEFTGGAGPVNKSVKVCDAKPIEIFWNYGGNNPNTCVLTMINSFSQTIYVKPAGVGVPGEVLPGGLITANCQVPVCQARVTGLTATGIYTDRATLNWSSPSTEAFGWDIYLVPAGTAAPNDATVPTKNILPNNPQSWEVTDLKSDTPYDFYVRVHCSSPQAPWSSKSTFATAISCPKPTALNVTGISLTQATLNWQKGTPADNNWDIYLIKSIVKPETPTDNPPAGPLFIQGVSQATTTYTVTGLEPATIYYYYIRTICPGNDIGAWAGPYKFNTRTCNISDQCKYQFIMTDKGGNGWENGRVEITQNGILISTIGSTISGGGPTTQLVDLCTNLPYKVTLTIPGGHPEEIGLEIRDINNDILKIIVPGDLLGATVPVELNSGIVNCSPPSCLKPTLLTVANITSHEVTLGWKENSGAAKWEVYVKTVDMPLPDNTAPVGDGTAPYYIADTNPVTITGLSASTFYEYYVRALCSDTDKSNWTIVKPTTGSNTGKFSTRPENDNCSGAKPVTVNNTTTCLAENKASGVTTGASASAAGSMPLVCTGNPGDDVWFSFVATSDMHIITIDNVKGASTDMVHTVYADSGNSCSGFTELFCSDNDTSIVHGLIPGTTYKIRVFTKATLKNFEGTTFDLCITTPPAITNDDCATAMVLPVNENAECEVKTNVSLTRATASAEANSCVGTADDDVWFTFVAKTNEQYISLSNIVGTTKNLNFAVYSGACGSMTNVICSKMNTLVESSKSFVPGQTYYVRVWSNEPIKQSADFDICITTIHTPVLGDDSKYTATQLVEDVLLGSSCANVTNVTYRSGEQFDPANRPSLGYFTENNSGFPFKDGVVMTTGSVRSISGPNTSTLSQGTLNWTGDADLEAIIKKATGQPMKSVNATVLEFDFVPLSANLSFNFLFGSDEYGTWQCTYPDAFAFLLTNTLSGVTENLAVLPDSQIPVSVVTIRDKKYNGSCESANVEYFDHFYYGNAVDGYLDKNPLGAPLNVNGITKKLTAKATVFAGVKYHIKMVIADRGDNQYDSMVFLEGGSFDTGKVDLGPDLLIANGDALCAGDTYVVDSKLSPNDFNFVWKKNGEVISGATERSYTVTDTGDYSLEATYKGSTCHEVYNIRIEYYPSPGTPATLELCSSESSNGFDLTKNTTILLEPYMVNSHLVEYYPTTEDADAKTNEIVNTTAYVVSDQLTTVYARVESDPNATEGIDDCVHIVPCKLEIVNCGTQKGISPNSGTKNANFDLSGTKNKLVEIYNRYGTKVYSKENYKNEWHGQSNSGSDLPDGTYFYVIHLLDGKTETGWIYINRKQ
ncbi:MAG: choice-of-anchor L domain-containing protein [Flavobacterium sp.]